MRRIALFALVLCAGCPVVQTVDAGVKHDAGRPVVDAGKQQTDFSISVEVKGLEGRGMILRVNGINDLPVSANGFVTFEQTLTAGDVYAVTVGVQPSAPTQTCTVTNGTGTITNADIADVVVKCVTNRYAIGGTVVGLTGLGLTLRNNNTDAISITKNGPFAFPITYAPNAGYAVTIFNQPVGPNQVCTVSGGTGNVGNSDVSSVVINCDSFNFTVGGTISGLSGSITLRNNGSDTLTLTSNGSFAFGVPLPSNSAYSVEVVTQPGPNASCYIDQASGVVGTENVTTVTVTCTTMTHFIGGTLTGLGVNKVTLLDNGIDPISLSADGPFRFPRPVASGSMYKVTVGAQPLNQRCGVTRGEGTVDALDVTSVQVTCGVTYQIGGQLIGATGPITLTNNTEDLVVPNNGQFAFVQRLLPGEMYNMSVKVQPADGKSLCTIDIPSGTVGTKDISTFVRCTKIGTSCSDIMANNPGAADGKYYIDPDGAGPILPFIATCDMTLDNGGWMLVLPGLVLSTPGSNVTLEKGTDTIGGAVIKATSSGTFAVGTNCGIVSSSEVFFKDIVPWTQIRSDWTFTGNGYCFSIFGNMSNMPGATALAITPYQPGVDVIRKQKAMGGALGDLFDGTTARCTDTVENFWDWANDYGTRSAEIILRRSSSTATAGIGLGVSCATYNNAQVAIPTWTFSNMWIR